MPAVLSLRAIRRKIRGVGNVQKITQAMKMVAAARLRRVQDKVTAGRPYAEKMREMVETLAPHLGAIEHPLLRKREVCRVGLVVVAGERGLCGSYNNNVIREAQGFLNAGNGTPTDLFCVGRRSADFFGKTNYAVKQNIAQIGVDTPFNEVRAIAADIVGWFTSGAVDEVHIAYTTFLSAGRQIPTALKFLPISSQPSETEDVDRGEKSDRALDYLFEPLAPELLGILLPRYVENQIYQLLLEALASEFAARMNAMTLASENCDKLLESLTLQFNKARQGSITTELLEMSTAAEALKASA